MRIIDSMFKINLFRFGTIPLIGCILFVTGCQTSRPLTRDMVKSKDQEIRISSVQLKDGNTIDFTSEPLGYAVLRDSSIYHMKTDGTIELIPLNKVELGKSKRLSTMSESGVDNIVWIVMGSIVMIFLLLRTIHFDIGG
jgi:hypothetical protein